MLVLLIAELLPDCSKKSIRTCSITCTLVKILKLQFFATTVNSLLDNHLPLRLIKANSNDKPWITPEIKDPISKRQDACAAGKSENFGFYRNKISAVCKKSRSAYYHSNISDVQQCKSRKWWSTLSSIAGLSTPKNISTLMHDNLPFSDAALAHLFNDKFIEVGSSLPRLSWTPLPIEKFPPMLHISIEDRDRATYFCFESWDSMILLVLSHQKFWRDPIKLDLWEQVSIFASQGRITNSKMHFLGSTLHKNARFLR